MKIDITQLTIKDIENILKKAQINHGLESDDSFIDALEIVKEYSFLCDKCGKKYEC